MKIEPSLAYKRPEPPLFLPMFVLKGVFLSVDVHFISNAPNFVDCPFCTFVFQRHNIRINHMPFTLAMVGSQKLKKTLHFNSQAASGVVLHACPNNRVHVACVNLHTGPHFHACGQK